ncbi:MAG: 30S ribosomal protein S20 [Candidatus Saccharibacteria bacterium]|nr:30S ribosomal protein S20 [Candidatus Saccharibacteria bacterium]
MPIIKSAKKRVRVAAKATKRNVRTKRSLKSALKAFGRTKSGSDARKAQSALDTAAKKNLMHKNKAARKQRQLARAAKAAGVKPTAAAKKAAKAPAKKAPAKKPAAKKAPAKKK